MGWQDLQKNCAVLLGFQSCLWREWECAHQRNEQGRLRGCNVVDGAGSNVRSVADNANALLNEDELLALSQRENSIQHLLAHHS